ncbi:hypothetical protein ILUMI_10825, partial [Ignelater luminosus]
MSDLMKDPSNTGNGRKSISVPVMPPKKNLIRVLNRPRPEKKLVVVTMDQVIFDANSPMDNFKARPFFHEFFTKVYEFYDIAIWSSKSMEELEDEMILLGMNKYPDYKFLCCLDMRALLSVPSNDRTVW